MSLLSPTRTPRVPRYGFRLAGPMAGALLAAVAGLTGCGGPGPALPESALVITQIPAGDAGRPAPQSEVLDVRYPAGSRVIVVPRPEAPDRVTVLSRGLAAAGDPVLDPSGQEVLFVGRESAAAPWQIYRAPVSGRTTPVRVTSSEGGACDPAWLPAGRFVFSAPVSPLHPATPPLLVPALYSQAVTGGPPQRLTFGTAPATDPTVLADGRILFVSAVPGGAAPRLQSLFTINNDGTEPSAFAAQHDGPAAVRRPRAAPDGRVFFLVAGVGSPVVEGRIESVRMARPYRSRTVVLPSNALPCRSVEPLASGEMLLTLGPDGSAGIGPGTFAVYRAAAGAGAGPAGTPVFDDPAWHEIEALPAVGARRFMGRLSNVDPARRDGTLLCLDVNRTDRPFAAARGPVRDGRVRVIRQAVGQAAEVLGEIPLADDGSFLATVPADVALAFELLAADGTVVERCPPAAWVRPGENRSCIGCHEPHNHAAENRRPRAVLHPAVSLTGALTPADHLEARNAGGSR